MIWNWQKKDWPAFTYEVALLDELELTFARQSGFLLGAYQHINHNDKDLFTVDLLSNEAYKTSEIEGEYLSRDSLRSSIKRHFGLGISKDRRHIPAAEQGIADMMCDLYQSFADPLTDQTLFEWHCMLASARFDLQDVGRYRTHPEPMQVISGYHYRQKIHFEAPPSEKVPHEMNQFICWFNHTAPTGKSPLSPLTRAGIAHLYFISIHPFEDGNGRIARALVEKALAQCLGQPSLIALSQIIQKHKKAYYDALEQANKFNEISNWLIYFARTILSAQQYTQQLIDFLIQKAKFYDRTQGQLNARQEKVIARIFRKGLEGFEGGLSAKNYMVLSKTSRATATRDLQDLVKKNIFTQSGSLKSTRYFLIKK